MPKKSTLIAILCSAFTAAPGCFVRHRTVAPAPAAAHQRPVLPATKDELIQRVHQFSDRIQNFVLRANLSPSVLDPSRGVATDYATVGAYILFERPANMRILGQDPVVESTIFDMVSTGGTFRVSIPPKKRFLVGSNDAPPTSQNKLENLRPTAFLISLLIDPPDPASETPVLVHDTPQSIYVLLVLRRNQDQFALARAIYFDHYTLQITRQKTFDPAGEVVSDTSYTDWADHDGIPYPSTIDIQRPRDNYELQIAVSTLRFNTPDVTEAKFVLAQPAGTQVEELK